MKAKNDYEYMRYLYEIRGEELADIAKEQGVSHSFLEKKAAREGWQRCTEEDRHGCLKMLFEISDKLEESIKQNLDGDVDIKNYKELTSAIKDALAIRRNLYRLPTLSEESAQRLALEKLDLDRVKYSSEEKERSISVEFACPEFCE